MSELHDLLHRATDLIENPGLQHAAMREAQRRRTRRRGAAAAAGASAVVAILAVSVQVAGGDQGEVPPSGPGTMLNIPTTNGPMTRAQVWPTWDPHDVGQLPMAPDDVASRLPDVLDPPASSPQLSGHPIAAAVVAVVTGDVVQLLADDGAWRSVPIKGVYPVVVLSPGGTCLAVSYDGDRSVTLYNLRAGQSWSVDAPDALARLEVTWDFVDEDTLLVSGGDTTYTVDADTGDASKTPYAGGNRAIDPTGSVVVSADWGNPKVLTDYAQNPPRTSSMQETGRLVSIQAATTTIAGLTYDQRPLEVVVADRATLTPTAHLPILDKQAAYGNGGLTIQAITDDALTLLRVADLGRDGDGFHLIAFDPKTGDLSQVTRVAGDHQVTFPADVLRH